MTFPRICLPLVLLVAVPSRQATAVTVTAAVPLQDSSCPGTSASPPFTGHALFEYRIEQSGAVQGIKLLYADVQPTDRRAAFVAEVQGCLAKWRYRPATTDGVPTATLMKVAFHRFPPAPPGGPELQLPGGRIVPEALMKQIRTATLAFTDTLLSGRGYTEARGDGWFLRTDLPKSALDDIRKTLEFSRRVFEEAFPGRPDSRGTPEVTIILFKDEEEFRQLSAFDNVIPGRSPVAGQYDGELRIIYSALGARPMPVFVRMVAHEATHHFTNIRVGGPRGPVPRWLGEGISQYVECLKMAKPGKIKLDALDRGQVSQPAAFLTGEETMRGSWVYPKRAEQALPVLKENLSKVDLEALLDGRLDRHFFGEGAEVLYDVSWLLVHYLLNADGGRHRERFRGWVLVPEGERSSATLSAAVGVPIGDVHNALGEYLKRIQ